MRSFIFGPLASGYGSKLTPIAKKWRIKKRCTIAILTVYLCQTVQPSAIEWWRRCRGYFSPRGGRYLKHRRREKKRSKKAAIRSKTCSKQWFVNFLLTRAECVISMSSETFSSQTREGELRWRCRRLFYFPLQERRGRVFLTRFCATSEFSTACSASHLHLALSGCVLHLSRHSVNDIKQSIMAFFKIPFFSSLCFFFPSYF